MDDIELAIHDAWRKIEPRLLADPAELQRRLARRRSATLARPPRAWCIAVRASDTRINPATAMLCPEDAAYPGRPDLYRPHQLTLSAALLRRLCKPVTILRPGEPWQDVAAKLGIATNAGLRNARIRRVIRSHYLRKQGKLFPLLFTDQPLDPAARDLVALADPLWTWTARYLFTRIPDDLQQTLPRVPAYRPTSGDRYRAEQHPEIDLPARSDRPCLPPPPPDYAWYKWENGVYIGDARERRRRPILERRRKWQREHRREHPRPSRSGGSLQFCGWKWICPRCNRTANIIYLPLPPLSLLAGTEAHRHEGTEAIARPLRALVPDAFVPSASFACYRCHRIRVISRIDPNSWNHIIAHLTGGLLYGREVPRPDAFKTEPIRKRAYHPQPLRPAPRRQQVLRRLLNGWTTTQIARSLGIKRSAVSNHIHLLCKQESVPNRTALAEKLGSKHPQPDRITRAQARRKHVRELLIQGVSYKQIIAEVGTNLAVMERDANEIYKAEGVRGRKGLQRKLEPQMNTDERR